MEQYFSLEVRLNAIQRFREGLVLNSPLLLDSVLAEVHRAPSEVLGSDILPTAAAAKYLAKHAAKILKPVRATSTPFWLLGVKAETHHRPWGRVGIIGTWNYPIYLSALPIMQALAAGNTVLFKPSEKVPKTCSKLVELFWDAGVSREQLQLLPATREAGPELLEAGIDYLHFTGSEGVGRTIAIRLGQRLIPSTLELSGIDAVVVRADADTAFAAQAVWYGVTLNAGQTCMAVRRVFVNKNVYAKFVEELSVLCAKTGTFKMVCDETWLNKVTQDAIEKGARKLSTTGNLAVFVDGSADCLLAQESGFGPACMVIPVADDEEAIRLHNCCRFGLTASIYTNNITEAQVMALRLNVGSVLVNDVIAPTAHPGTPFGGRGASGWGVTGGPEGLRSFTCPQVVLIRKGQFRPHIEGAIKNDPHVQAILEGMLRGSHSARFGDRIRGTAKMIRAMMRFGKGKPE